MKRSLFVGACLMIMVCAFPVLASQHEGPQKPILMKQSGRKEVVFKHNSHAKIDCGVCHHELPGRDEQFLSCAEAGCHAVGGKGAGSYYQIIHKRVGDGNTCMSCHQAVAKKHPERREALTDCTLSKCHGG